MLVACSGGADSLALAAATAFVAPRLGRQAGLVTVDHGLQAGSAERAAAVADVGRARPGSTRSRRCAVDGGRASRWPRGGGPAGPLPGAGRGRPAAPGRRRAARTHPRRPGRDGAAGAGPGRRPARARRDARPAGPGRGAAAAPPARRHPGADPRRRARRWAWPRGRTRTTPIRRTPGPGSAADVLPALVAALGAGRPGQPGPYGPTAGRRHRRPGRPGRRRPRRAGPQFPVRRAPAAAARSDGRADVLPAAAVRRAPGADGLSVVALAGLPRRYAAGCCTPGPGSWGPRPVRSPTVTSPRWTRWSPLAWAGRDGAAGRGARLSSGWSAAARRLSTSRPGRSGSGAGAGAGKR